MKFPRAASGLLSCLALSVSMAAAQPAFQVADLSSTVARSSLRFLFEPLATLNGEVYFVADEDLLGLELWKTDGTAAGTVPVKDICPGLCSSSPSSLQVSNGALFFVADDGSHGRELWKTDGTVAGTVLVKDIAPGLADGARQGLLDFGGTLLFPADDGISGVELWKSDGTAAGTELVEDIRPGAAGSNVLPRVANGSLALLDADDGVHGREPWVSDGTAAGTHLVKDINFDFVSSTSVLATLPASHGLDGAEWIATSGGLFVFRATDGSSGREPWVTDGTAAGTFLLGNLAADSESSDPAGLTEVGSSVFFSTRTGDLWKTDGTVAGTTIVKDFPFLADRPNNLTRAGTKLFFSFDDFSLPGELEGQELWVSDGTSAGTVFVKDINPGDAPSLQEREVLAELGGQLLFIPTVGQGQEVWRSDGTAAGTVKLAELGQGVRTDMSITPLFAVAAGELFFRGEGPDGRELWKTDGTQAGTGQVKDIFRLTSSLAVLPSQKALVGRHGSQLLFRANDDGSTNVKLWTTDGSAAGTSILFPFSVTEARPLGATTILTTGVSVVSTDGTPEGTQTFSPSFHNRISELTPFKGALFFGTDDPNRGRVLYRTDGMTMTAVKDLDPASNIPSTLEGLTVAGDTLFFAHDGSSGSGSASGVELHKSDGTSAGTVLVKDINAAGSSAPAQLTAVDRALFFSAATPDEGRELWKSDGSEAGTVLVKDIRPGSGSAVGTGPGQTAALGALLFFVADDGASGRELWRSDGTEAGTVLVKDIFPGAAPGDPRELTRVRNRLFFVADDGVHGRELWVSDGTEAGTVMVADLRAGAEGSLPQRLTAMGHRLLFSAHDDTHGREPWTSDGTALGTTRLQDIAPGPASSSPFDFLRAGANVYFGANDGVAGLEPWAFPRSVLGTTFGDVPTGFWAWAWIEALVDTGITGGCGGGFFCPDPAVNRAEAAVFLVRASRGVAFTPPAATGTVFADVPADHWAGAWIEQLAADGITGGCDPGNYCPGQALSRAQMAVLLLRARYGPSFVPPAASGTVFADVPGSHWAAAWIERLAAEGITGGCGGGNFCPDRPVTRAEMAVLLVRAFDLPLP